MISLWYKIRSQDAKIDIRSFPKLRRTRHAMYVWRNTEALSRIIIAVEKQ
jgi:hypothetical protein